VRRILLIGGGLIIIVGLALSYWGIQGSSNECPVLLSPVDTASVTSVLYPGQYRGGDYKAHGGFRFDGQNHNDVIVRAPISAKLTRAGRYIEIGEVQYIFIFETSCGLSYRFDHLLTLTPKFQAMVNKLPPAVGGNSKFVSISPTIEVDTGETIATDNPNVSFDFGVYLNKSNENGLCWLDLLPSEDAARLKTLPGGDHQSGKTSDYCL